MNRLLSVYFLLSLAFIGMAQGKPEVKFSLLSYDLGFVTKDAPVVTIPVTVQNTGSAPLVIQKVSVGCPCVSVDYPRSPLAAGESAVVKITYDGSNQPLSRFTKEIFFTTNTESQYCRFLLNGELVKAKPAVQEPVEEKKATFWTFLKALFS